VATVGGVTIDTPAATAANPSPQYRVLAVNSANQLTFTAAQTASASAGPTAAAVDWSVYLAPGLADSTGGAGYGTGAFGTGTYGSATTTVYYARTHSIRNLGQNMLVQPRGGGLYEWAPYTTQTELVTNGGFTGSSTGWTEGTGWAYGANNEVGSSAMGDLSQSVTLNAGAWHIVEAEFTRTSGSVQCRVNGVNVGSAVSSTGKLKAVFYGGNGGAQTLAFRGTGYTGSVDNVSVKVLITAHLVTNAPTQSTCMEVTAEGHVMLGGTIEEATGLLNPMHLRWSGLRNAQVWTPADDNLAGGYTLSEGGRIVGIRNGRAEVLVWTDDALYAGTYSQDPNLVYEFRLVAKGCGLMGPNAVAILDGVAFWKSPAGENFRYAGGAPQPMQSTMRRDFFENLAKVQQDKVFAAPISGFGDVITLYPDSRDGNECSRYEHLSTLANQGLGAWAPGTFDRTCWVDAGALPYPLAVSSSGQVFFQEKGNTANGGPINWWLETGAIDIGDGNNLFMVRSIIPDFAGLLGGFSMTLYTYAYPNATPAALGPYPVNSTTTKVDTTALGRQIAFRFEGNAAPAFARMGSLRFDIVDSGMQF
jgi:hypothetical protein